MPDKVQHYNDDTSVDNALAVAGTLGISGAAAASFFNSGYGQNLNSFIIKKKFEYEETKKYFSANNYDLTSMSRTGYAEAVQEAHKRFENVEKNSGTTAYRYSDDANLRQFVEWFKERKHESTPGRLYRSNIKADVISAIDRAQAISPRYKEILKDNLDVIINNSGGAGNVSDFNKILARFQARMSPEEFANPEVKAVLKAISEIVADYRTKTPLYDFELTDAVRNSVTSTNNAMFDIAGIQARQAKRKNSFLARIANGVMGDSNVSIDQVMQWKAGNTEEWKRIHSIFGNELFIAFNDSGEQTRYNVIDELTKQVEEWESANDSRAETLRKLELNGIKIGKNGQVYTNADTLKFSQQGSKSVVTKFPISMMHFQDTLNNGGMSDFYRFEAGDVVPNLARLIPGSSGDRLMESVVFSNGRFYKYDSNGNLQLIDGIKDEYKLVSIKSGLRKERYEKGFGYGPENDTSIMSGFEKFVNKLGLEYDKVIKSEELGTNANIYGKFTDENIGLVREAYNIILNKDKFKEYAIKGNYKIDEFDIDSSYGILSGANRYNRFLKKNTYGITGVEAEKLKGIGLEDDILEYIAKLDKNESFAETIREIADTKNNVIHTVHNGRIKQLAQSYLDNPSEAIRNSITSKDPFITRDVGQYDIVSFRKQLQRELWEEVLLRYQGKENFSYADLFKSFDQKLGSANAEIMKDLVAATDYFARTGKYSGSRPFLNVASDVLTGLEGMQNDLKAGNSNAKIVESRLRGINTRYASQTEDLRRMRATYNISPIQVERASVRGMDIRNILAEINKGHYEKASKTLYESSTDVLNQFFNDPASSFSLPFDHMMFRINDVLNGDFSIGDISNELPFSNIKKITGHHIGLGLKHQDATTGGKIFKNLMLKRVLPLYIGYQALDLLDDASKGIKGTGLKESALSGIANLEMLTKKITGVIGMDDWLKDMTRDNAIIKYYSGLFGGDIDPTWKTAEEEREYYRHGYNAIRKARYWTFGSSNEFRGGKIQYFEPNSLRMARSNYYGESMWNGSFLTKWNPIRLFDPYYKEYLHYNDRPYPVSGGYWDDNTPWGVILNATIGDNFMKPRIELHGDRLYGGVDVKAIISHVNEQIRNRASGENKEPQNIFRIQSGKIKSVDFASFNEPTYEDNIATLDRYGNNTTKGSYKQYEGELPSISELESGIADAGLTEGDKIAIAAAKGNIAAAVLNRMNRSSLNIVKTVNNTIRNKTASFDSSQGMLTESVFSSHYDVIENFLNDGETVESLLGQSRADYIKQMETTTRLLSGLYGYIGNLAFGFGDYNNKRLATSSDMTSTSRWFWDQNYGGIGGEPMEAIRRFIPEYRRNSIINPLMNEMPEWIPEKFRFGDPFTAIPNGEARMPGRGYESLNDLHPDVFGKYGAFDRYKILGDIAPGSPEFKLWKRIATHTVKDKQLKAEMKDIEKRISLQRKERDFQSYRFAGKDTTSRRAYITEVMSSGKFKVTGSEETYKLAGVDVSKKADESSKTVLKRYIQPGMEVTLVTDDNPNYARNNDKDNTINAGLLVEGKSISNAMLNAGDAERRESDLSAAAAQSGHNWEGNLFNAAIERFAHANIPIIHDRFLRVNDAMEDYKDQYLYGSAFQDWSRPIDTFIMPMLKTYASSGTWMGIGIMSDILYNNMDMKMDGSKTSRNFLIRKMKEAGIQDAEELVKRFADKNVNKAKWINKLDRGSLLGNISAEILHYGSSGMEQAMRRYGRRIGNAAALTYAASVAPENLGVSVLSWSRLGYLASDLLMNKSHNKKMALAGAAIGAARWAGSVKLLASDETANSYIPDDVRKRWDMQDYFD